MSSENSPPREGQITHRRKFLDPQFFQSEPQDPDVYRRAIGGFVPPDAFDAHGHWYDLRHLFVADSTTPPIENPGVGYQAMVESMRRWMGEDLVTRGLYFPFPARDLDCSAANAFLAEELAGQPASRGLMMIRPQDDPDEVEKVRCSHGFAGFKVYHLFARREDTFQSEQGEFLPEWAWEAADREGLWITMHMVLPRALSDPRNASYIREHCLRYPGARLVLAHAARGFNASDTADAIDEIRGLDNVFFDTSAICEPTALEAILRATGTTRLMYGSDFPVSETRGRPFSLADGFMWIYSHNADWQGWEQGGPNPVGIESLIALRQACRTLALRDTDIERIFRTNAEQLLGVQPVPTGERVQRQYQRAKELIPGGTQLLSKRPELFAPGHWPAYYEQAIGCEVIDTAGRRFVDMTSNGILACILGFSDPDVNAAVIRRVHLGSMATQQTHDEVELAEKLVEIHPWAEMARFPRTGGESMAVAVRIARAATGRDKVAICGYHGWHDWYLAANLGSGPDPLAGHLLPGLEPAGVPAGLRGATLPFTYNRLDELEAIVAAQADDLAAIVMEPTRQIDPQPGFLEGVREIATRCGALLVFDEISIGWRLCLGGAHRLFGVDPDLAVFAKTISNGFAMGAVIGTGRAMDAAQSTFVSSAYWTEGVGPAAALAAVGKMQRLDVPPHLARIGNLMLDGWRDLGARFGVPVRAGGRPELVSVGFDHPQEAALMTLFTTRMLARGYLAGGGFNPTLAHQPRHVSACLEAAAEVFPEMGEAIARDDAVERVGGQVKHGTFARLTG